jgi:acyl carrier protein
VKPLAWRNALEKEDEAMGLDTVELEMVVEDTFGIRIPDEDAGAIQTVGQLYEYICTHRPKHDQPGICLTAAAFYRLRRGLIACFGVERANIRPGTSLDSVVPVRGRRSAWRSLEGQLELSLPQLVRPTVVVAALLVCALTFGGAVFADAPPSLSTGVSLMAGVVSAIVVGLVSILLTRWLATEPERHFATVGGLAHAVLTINYQEILAAKGSDAVCDVWETLRIIIATELGVSMEQVTYEASFVNDLGAD